MHRRHLFLAMAAAACLLIPIGCGGADEEGSAAENTAAVAENGTNAGEEPELVSKEEFIDQANSVCAKRSAEVKVNGQRVFKKIYNDPEPVAAKKMATQVVIPAFEGELRDLRALNIPPGDGGEVSAIYAAIEKMIDEVKADPTAQGFYPYTKAEKLAAKYGLTACGHP